jgi:hypothetical protein
MEVRGKNYLITLTYASPVEGEGTKRKGVKA